VIGATRWYVEEQVLSWNFPGLTEGYLDSTRLEHDGGWSFTPDMAWANIQSLAFQHFHTLIASQGFVASNEGGWVDRVTALVVPTVFANEPGCDGLHWLDDTVFRPCCDVHDMCYQAYGCNWMSWWQWWSSWSCDECNFSVVFCFRSGGREPFRRILF
jgi:hypothetical protein